MENKIFSSFTGFITKYGKQVVFSQNFKTIQGNAVVSGGFFKCFLLNSVPEFFKCKRGAWHGFHVRAHGVTLKVLKFQWKKRWKNLWIFFNWGCYFFRCSVGVKYNQTYFSWLFCISKQLLCEYLSKFLLIFTILIYSLIHYIHIFLMSIRGSAILATLQIYYWLPQRICFHHWYCDFNDNTSQKKI